MESKINELKYWHNSYLCKEISCNIQHEIDAFKREIKPTIDQLKSELEAAGYKVVLHSSGSIFHGGPAITVTKEA